MSKPEESDSASKIPDDLLEILVCPMGKKPLRVEGQTLVCTNCGAVSYTHLTLPTPPYV